MNEKFLIHHSISSIDKKNWDKYLSSNDPFLKTSFLEHFEQLSKEEVKPFYIALNNGIIYGHLITIKGKKIANYLERNSKISVKKWLLKKVNFKFFCFGNTHLSNISTCSFKENQLDGTYVEELMLHIKKKYKVKFFLLPDHFLKCIEIKKKELSNRFKFIKIDPDMTLEIPKEWNSFQDYKNAIQSKYKKRLRKVFKDSKPISTKEIPENNLVEKLNEMDLLYKNVYSKSAFSGPPFNIEIFKSFIANKEVNFSTYGYYTANNKLVAFSSEFFINSTLYSYFIGLDYKFNEEFSIYNRILYDTITNGINKKVHKIIFGRTAAEFKSTIGAVPSPSESAVYIANGFLSWLFNPFIQKLSPAKWIQRRPFK